MKFKLIFVIRINFFLAQHIVLSLVTVCPNLPKKKNSQLRRRVVKYLRHFIPPSLFKLGHILIFCVKNKQKKVLQYFHYRDWVFYSK